MRAPLSSIEGEAASYATGTLPFTCLPLKPRHSPCWLLVLASYVKDGMLLNEKHRPVLRTGLSAMSPGLSAVMHSSWLIQASCENSK